jgi:hypothetical protein
MSRYNKFLLKLFSYKNYFLKTILVMQISILLLKISILVMRCSRVLTLKGTLGRLAPASEVAGGHTLPF